MAELRQAAALRPAAHATEQAQAHAQAPAPSSNENDRHVQIRVVDSTGASVDFRIKNTTPLRRAFDVYCERTGHARAATRFLFDGVRIADDDTPLRLGMLQGDTIDAIVQQVGGGVGAQVALTIALFDAMRLRDAAKSRALRSRLSVYA